MSRLYRLSANAVTLQYQPRAHKEFADALMISKTLVHQLAYVSVCPPYPTLSAKGLQKADVKDNTRDRNTFGKYAIRRISCSGHHHCVGKSGGHGHVGPNMGGRRCDHIDSLFCCYNPNGVCVCSFAALIQDWYSYVGDSAGSGRVVKIHHSAGYSPLGRTSFYTSCEAAGGSGK